MPAGPLDFRGVCGCFIPRQRRCLDAVRRIHLQNSSHGLLFGSLVAYTFWTLLLLRSGDIELNPGPPKPAPIFTRSSSARHDSGNSVGGDVGKSPRPNPSLREIFDKLTTMEQNFDKRLDDMSHKLCQEYEEVKKQVTDLQSVCDDIKQENNCLREELNSMKAKTDDLENRSRSNNLLFYGFKKTEAEKESNFDCENKLKDMLSDKLGITHDMVFDRVHRTG